MSEEMDWKKASCNSPETASISSVSDYVFDVGETFSPIDSFYKGRDLLMLGLTSENCAERYKITNLIMVGLISETENYFRDLFSGIIKMCPLVKINSAEKTINLARAWFGSEELEKGIFENHSFSDASMIKKTLKNVIGLSLPTSNQILSPLKEFEKLCELRHAIVHSAGLLAGKNAIKLGLSNSTRAVEIKITYADLQNAAVICTSLVQATNTELFIHISKRWLHDWSKHDEYKDRKKLNTAYKLVWQLFVSEIDKGRSGLGQTPVKRPMVKVRTKLIKALGR